MKEHQKAVIEFFKGLSSGRLLDAGSGGDALGRALKERGFDVYSLDLFSRPYLKDRFVRADLNANIPFADGSFDFVLLSESLQYLENHFGLFREFRRVLKKGGSLVVSMPNVLNASSRLYFLQRGYYPYFKPVRSVDASKGWDDVAYHPVSFVDVLEIARRSGFALKGLKASSLKSSGVALYALLKGLYSFGLLFEKNKDKAALLRQLSSKEALLGDHLIMLLEAR